MVVAVALSVLPVAPAAAADDASPTIIFDQKSFIDTGRMVHVEGTLTGEGIGYKNNRAALTCYRDERQCETVHIEAAGVHVSFLGPPIPFTVRLWAEDRILADSSAPCGGSSISFSTWIVDRARQTAELIEHPCIGDKVYHYTIEDPPFWKKAKEAQ